ncbi:MAG: GNAT family N-acetyltransferase [Acidobacteria bacterium]|nr:GNAT family N-acetyltransferase [Acidobacteriota bacterium]
MARIDIRAATAEEVARVFDDAFADYPVMRFVLGDEEPYAERLSLLHDLWSHEAVLHGFDVIVAEVDGVVAAAATAARPGTTHDSDEHAALESETWRRLGDASEARYRRYSVAAHKVHSTRPGWYLDMLGVRADFQGHGLGRVLLEEIQARSDADATSEGVLLTTENPVNVAFYEKFGYEVVAHEHVTDSMETWGFFREDAPQDEGAA